MHTGSQLEGRVCKCLDCAAARHQLRLSIAWERDGERMAKATLLVARAEAEVKAAQMALLAAKRLFDATVAQAQPENDL